MRFAALCFLAYSTAFAQTPIAQAAFAQMPSAQTGEGSRTDLWSSLRAQNPNLDFTLRLVREGAYHEGEPIRADLHLPPGSIIPGARPPGLQWSFVGLLLDPATSCGTLAAPCYQQATRFGGIVSGPVSMSATRPPIALNGFMRTLSPRHYRAVALSRKLVLREPPPAQPQYIYAEPAQYAVSNTVEFDVIAASPAWTRQAIASSLAILKVPDAGTAAGREAHEQAAEQLLFLDTPAAWSAVLESLPNAENSLLPGLANTHQPLQVCALMQAAIATPSQSVSQYYLDTLGRVCASGQMTEPPKGEQPAYWKEWSARREAAMAAATSALAAGLPAKASAVKAAAFTALVERLRADRKAAWIPGVQAEFIKTYPALNSWQQRSLLSQFATTLRSREFVALVEGELERWKPGDYYEAVQSALVTLNVLDPGRAQARIVAELRKDRTWLDVGQLTLLPAAAAHFTVSLPTDDELIAGLAAAQRPGGWNVHLSMTALAKYASAKALPRVKAIYESQEVKCQPELMGYFVRVDPPYAARAFHSHAWDMQTEPPACTIQYFTRTPAIGMGPELEAYMVAYLAHRTVRIKQQAAQSLARFGSAAAQAPLWDTFRYFHDYWKGKGEQLMQNGEGVGLERELRNAIARGRHWLTTEADLHTLEALCITGNCIQETRQDLANWQKPLRIELNGDSGFHGTIAQYYAFDSREDFLEKLAQFPKGTEFRLMRDDAVVREFAVAHGLIILSQ